jgi:hypothetical protein
LSEAEGKADEEENPFSLKTNLGFCCTGHPRQL